MDKMLCLLLVLCFAASCDNRDSLNTEIIPVGSGSKYGYIDREGNYLINPQFDKATFFQDGVALVASSGLYGYIDMSGNFIIRPTYVNATTFAEGIAWVVKKGGAPLAIDKSGKALFTLKESEKAYCFSEGLARYCVTSPDNVDRYLYGFVDEKGETVISPTYLLATDFEDGLAAVMNEEGNYGYINKKGEVIVDYQFFDAEPFYKGRAVVRGDHAYGLIGKDGKYIVNPQFGYMRRDGEKYMIQLQGGNQFGWCDKNGKILINPQFETAWIFEENNLAPVGIGDKMGFIDNRGKIVINPQFDKASLFFDNTYALVQTNGKWGAIDRSGSYIFNPQFNEIGPLSTSFVESEYFNIEAITAIVQSLITQDKIDGVIDSNTSLSRIMTEYNLSENSIHKNQEFQELQGIIVSQDATIHLSMGGTFYDKVSDGWWGYDYVLNKNVIPSKFRITIDLKKRGSGKAEEVMMNILRSFESGGRSAVVKQYISELDYGSYHLVMQEVQNKVVITVTAIHPSHTSEGAANVNVNSSTFSVEVPEVVKVGDQFRLIYTVNKKDADDFKGPDIKGIDVLFGPGKSRGTDIAETGEVVAEKIIYTYILMADKIGTFTIPEATVRVGTDVLTSNTVSIKVVSK